MSQRNLIRAAKAMASRETARAIGLTVILTHRNESPVTLLALMIEERIDDTSNSGFATEERVCVVEIPLQTGFIAPTAEAEPISLGDKIVILSRDYFVADARKDTTGAKYIVRCAERKRLSTGV